MRLNNIAFHVILILFSCNVGFAQQGKKPLREVLQAMEHRFDISFTFLDETIEGISIDTPADTLTLTETLDYLTKETRLGFTRLDQRFITVAKPTPIYIELCGVVIDKSTNKTIAGAIVQKASNTVLSGPNGRFALQALHADDTLFVRMLGYRTLSVTAEELTTFPCKTLELSPLETQLREVIITSYLTSGIRKVAEGSLSIQPKELGILPGLTEPDVLFAVQALPGIQSIDETVSNLNVRGGTHDQNLLLWDGMRMYQQGHFFGLISAFNPYLTKEVNLIKNGTSAQMGDGVSSTIDIRSDDEVATSFSGAAGLNLINGDLYGKIPLSKNAALQIATRRSIADLMETPTYRSYYDRAFRGTEVAKYNPDVGDTVSADQRFSFYDVSAKFLFDLSAKDKLRIHSLLIRNNISYRETELVNNLPESKESSLQQHNVAAGIAYSRLWNARVRTNAQWYVSQYDLRAINYDILNDQKLIQDNGVLDFGLKLDTRILLSDQVDIFTGYQLFEVGVSNLEDINNPDFYRFRKSVLRTHVVFAETNYSSPSDNTNIRAGVRANLFYEFETVRIEPRLAFSQKIADNFSFELLAEAKSQTTTQVIDFQNDFLGVEKRRWIMTNNKDIPLIRSKQASAGLHYHQPNLLIALEGYSKWVDDIITSSQGFQNQFQYVRSAGSYTTRGMDFLINQRVRKINSWISYSYATSDFRFKDLVPPGFPNNLDIRHRATWGLGYQSDHMEFSTGINWHTGKPFTKPVAGSAAVNGKIQYQDPNTSRLENYWRIDVSARYKFNMSHKVRAVAAASIWNVLNRDNIIDAYYQASNAGEIALIKRSALALTSNLIFRVEF